SWSRGKSTARRRSQARIDPAPHRSGRTVWPDVAAGLWPSNPAFPHDTRNRTPGASRGRRGRETRIEEPQIGPRSRNRHVARRDEIGAGGDIAAVIPAGDPDAA